MSARAESIDLGLFAFRVVGNQHPTGVDCPAGRINPDDAVPIFSLFSSAGLMTANLSPASSSAPPAR